MICQAGIFGALVLRGAHLEIFVELASRATLADAERESSLEEESPRTFRRRRRALAVGARRVAGRRRRRRLLRCARRETGLHAERRGQ